MHAKPWNQEQSLIIPHLVFQSWHEFEKFHVEIIQTTGKGCICTFVNLDLSPLKHNIERHQQILRLSIYQPVEASNHLQVLLEIVTEHLLHKVQSKNLLTIVLDLIRLIWFHFFPKPFSLLVQFSTVRLVSRIHDDVLFRVWSWDVCFACRTTSCIWNLFCLWFLFHRRLFKRFRLLQRKRHFWNFLLSLLLDRHWLWLCASWILWCWGIRF